MKSTAVAIIYVAFFAMIAASVYFTRSAWPILGLFFIPSFESKNSSNG